MKIRCVVRETNLLIIHVEVDDPDDDLEELIETGCCETIICETEELELISYSPLTDEADRLDHLGSSDHSNLSKT